MGKTPILCMEKDILTNKTMRIQYMSDLHMEFAENSRYIKHCDFPVTGEVLVLAGDTFYLKDKVPPLGDF